MTPITDSLTASGIDDIVVWDNAEREDLAVYGRYAAIGEAKHDFIYVQDDDCVVSDLQLLVRWAEDIHSAGKRGVVCNMPDRFRHEFYSDHALVGFGACFHRDLPKEVFVRAIDKMSKGFIQKVPFFYRTCDIVVTGLSSRVLVDVEYQDLPWASDETRMWKQAQHVEERTRMLELVRQVRDGT